MAKFRHVLFLLVVSLVLTACGDAKVQTGGGGKKGNDQNNQVGVESGIPVRDFTLPDDAVEIEPGVFVVPGIHMRPGIDVYEVDPAVESDLVLDADRDTAELRGSAAQQVSDAQIGDILITRDVIARIGQIERGTDGSVTFVLEDFLIWDVIHGDWELELELDREGDESYPINADDYAVRRQLLSKSYPISYSSGEGAAKLTANATLSFSANPSMTFKGQIPIVYESSGYTCSNPQFNQKILWKQVTFCVDHLSLTIRLGADLDANATLSASSSASYKYPQNARMLENGLGEIPLVGPFALRPSLFLDRQAYVEASLKGELTMNASLGASLPLGFEYNNGGGFSMIPNRGNGVSTHANLGGSATLEASLEAGVWASTGFGLSVCTVGSSIAGLCIKGVEAGAKLSVSGKYRDVISTVVSAPEHCLQLDAEFTSSLVGKVELAAHAWKFKKSVTLVQASVSPFGMHIASWNDGGRYCSSGLSHQMHVDALNETFNSDVDCKDADENQLIGTCAEKFLVHCFDPTGECTGTAYEDGSYDMNWTSGERYESTIDEFQTIGGAQFPKVTLGEFFGIEGDVCADQNSVVYMSGGGEGCLVSAVITLQKGDDDCEEDEACEEGEEDEEGEEGEEGVYRYKKGDVLKTCLKESGSIEYECPSPKDGTPEKFTIDKDHDGKICMQGPCEFEKGYLDERDENRGLVGDN